VDVPFSQRLMQSYELAVFALQAAESCHDHDIGMVHVDLFK